jgi:glycine/D-amino acid oxidase-like deaminating enzyme
VGVPLWGKAGYSLAMSKRINIIGAGIIGASLAYQLSKSGADVRVIDAQSTPRGIATPMSWGWVNASWGNAPEYFKLRHHSMKLWKQFDEEVPGLQVNWCGGLLWDLPRNELEAFAASRNGEGYNVEILNGAGVAACEPQLADPPEFAVHAKGEASVEGVDAVEKLIAAAKTYGAQIITNTTVLGFDIANGQVTGVMTEEGVLEADAIVLAAGVGSKNLLQLLDIELSLDDPPGLLLRTAPAPEMLNGLVMAPKLHVRQLPDGRLLTGSDFVGSFDANDPQGSAMRLFHELQVFLRKGKSLQFEGFTVGYRPTPRDGVSALGWVKGVSGLYLCVTHSGITLAPAIATLCGAEILSGERHALLSPFAPNRLLAM